MVFGTLDFYYRFGQKMDRINIKNLDLRGFLYIIFLDIFPFLSYNGIITREGFPLFGQKGR